MTREADWRPTRQAFAPRLADLLAALVAAAVLFAGTWVLCGPPNVMASAGLALIAGGVGVQWKRRRLERRRVRTERRDAA